MLSALRRLNVFRPAPGQRFSRFDLWVYKLFYWRWNPILHTHPEVRRAFLEHMQTWSEARVNMRADLTVVQGGKAPPQRTV